MKRILKWFAIGIVAMVVIVIALSAMSGGDVEEAPSISSHYGCDWLNENIEVMLPLGEPAAHQHVANLINIDGALGTVTTAADVQEALSDC